MTVLKPIKPRGLFLGLSTVDLLFALESLPIEDTKTTSSTFEIATGGPATNAAVAFANLGGESTLASAVGLGSFRELIDEDLRHCVVAHVDLEPKGTDHPAISSILVTLATGARTIITSPAIDRAHPDALSLEEKVRLVENADVVMLDGHDATLAASIASLAREKERVVVLDGDLYNDGLASVLPYVTVAIFGKSFKLPGNLAATSPLEYFRSFGVAHVVGTNGPAPISIVTDSESFSVDVPATSAIDTLGAGDFFHGAFCFATAKGMSILDATIFARDVAVRTVQSFGTRSWLRAEP